MTLPSERTRAVIQTEWFLRTLLNSKLTPRVPKAVREQARRLLKHYPWPLYLEQSAEALPTIWGEIDE